MTALAATVRALLAFALPDSCLSCGSPLEAGRRHLCPSCSRSLSVDGLTLKPVGGVGVRAGFALDFGGPAGDLVRALKYGGRTSAAALLARAAETAARAASSGADCIVPVPLHAVRLRERGFNQTQVLGEHLAEALGLALVPGLVRERPTRTQTELPREARATNVSGAFGGAGLLRGRRVLLLDDVVTTGATLREAASAARNDGAADVMAFAVSGTRPATGGPARNGRDTADGGALSLTSPGRRPLPAKAVDRWVRRP